MKRRFSTAVLKERTKLFIAENCRANQPVRNLGMETLAKAVGVYTNPQTVEMDLFTYMDQLDAPDLIRDLFDWSRNVAREHVIGDLPGTLPQFQLELA